MKQEVTILTDIVLHAFQKNAFNSPHLVELILFGDN